MAVRAVIAALLGLGLGLGTGRWAHAAETGDGADGGRPRRPRRQPTLMVVAGAAARAATPARPATPGLVARPQLQARRPPALEPPQPISPTKVPYPKDAPPHDQPIVVRVKMLVGSDGLVQKVELVTHSLPVFDDAVVAAVRAFKFQPGRYGGKPVPVEINFTQTFQPPPPPPPAAERGHLWCRRCAGAWWRWALASRSRERS